MGEHPPPYDVAVIGAGIAGLSTAARLQAAGLRTLVLEAHGTPGGCAGWFHRSGFSFDVGATTLVDFLPGGVGGELLECIRSTRTVLTDGDRARYKAAHAEGIA